MLLPAQTMPFSSRLLCTSNKGQICGRAQQALPVVVRACRAVREMRAGRLLPLLIPGRVPRRGSELVHGALEEVGPGAWGQSMLLLAQSAGRSAAGCRLAVWDTTSTG